MLEENRPPFSKKGLLLKKNYYPTDTTQTLSFSPPGAAVEQVRSRPRLREPRPPGSSPPPRLSAPELPGPVCSVELGRFLNLSISYCSKFRPSLPVSLSCFPAVIPCLLCTPQKYQLPWCRQEGTPRPGGARLPLALRCRLLALLGSAQQGPVPAGVGLLTAWHFGAEEVTQLGTEGQSLS